MISPQPNLPTHPHPHPHPTHALFVHGMGRTPLSGWRMLSRLRAFDITTHTLGYIATLQSFESIRQRLVARIMTLSDQGDYILIGHSLGGVLIRAAVAALPPEINPPRQIFLLGSPVQPSLYAMKLQRNWLFRLLTGDCGQCLASPRRMANIGVALVPTNSIVGVAGWRGWPSPFKGELNDGIVSVSETQADWIAEEIRLPMWHTYLPSKKQIADLILARIKLQPHVTTQPD